MDPMVVTRIDEGLWQWSVPHPAWREGDDWDRVVHCVYLETPAAVVLFDPLVPEGADGDRFWRALDRDVARLGLPVVVLVTCAWHERSAPAVRERYGGRVWAPGDGGSLVGGAIVAGVEAISTGMPAPQDEVLFWVPERRSVVVGDILLGTGDGRLRVAPPSWYDGSEEERTWYRDGLAWVLTAVAERDPLRVLTSHGVAVFDDGAAAVRAAVTEMRAE